MSAQINWKNGAELSACNFIDSILFNYLQHYPASVCALHIEALKYSRRLLLWGQLNVVRKGHWFWSLIDRCKLYMPCIIDNIMCPDAAHMLVQVHVMFVCMLAVSLACCIPRACVHLHGCTHAIYTYAHGWMGEMLPLYVCFASCVLCACLCMFHTYELWKEGRE